MTTSFTSTGRLRSLLLTTLLLSIVVFGCKKSDSGDPNPSALAGNYKITAYTASGGGVTIDYIALSASPGGTQCLNDLVLTLNANGTASTNSPASCGGTDPTGGFAGAKWSVSGSTISFIESSGKEDYTYTQSGNKLTLMQTENRPSGTGNQTVAVTTKIELTKQ